jgi:glucokinase-like ROK family protein
LVILIDNLTTMNVKLSNKYSALNLIRYTPEGLSRADLARKLSLSRAAVSSIVNDLLENELIRETRSGDKTGGRRSVLLEINPDRGFVLGVDMGATHLSIILADFSAHVLTSVEMPFDVSRGSKICLDELDTRMQEFVNQNDLDLQKALAIGVGVPGPVVAEAGGVVSPPIMPGWDSFPIQSHLESLWSRPITLNNDAELGALGEWAYGAGRNERHLMYVKVGYGIGAGFLFDGQIYRGSTGSAGEIGHITINEKGPRCTCGNNGCLEAMAGGRSIADRARQAIKSGRRTQLNDLSFDEITALDVAMAAQKGDRVAQEIIIQAGEYLGIALASLVNVVNPSMIIIGGGVSQMGDLLLEPIRRTVRRRGLPAAINAVRISAAVLGGRSSGIGAITQALTLSTYRILEDVS